MPIKPIPDDTWRRLAALDARCSISMRRDDQWFGVGAGGERCWSGIGAAPDPHRKVWRVRISLLASSAIRDIIDTGEPHLADALLPAIEEAERRGWHKPAP